IAALLYIKNGDQIMYNACLERILSSGVRDSLYESLLKNEQLALEMFPVVFSKDNIRFLTYHGNLDIVEHIYRGFHGVFDSFSSAVLGVSSIRAMLFAPKLHKTGQYQMMNNYYISCFERGILDFDPNEF